MEDFLYHRFYKIESKHWWFVARRGIVLDQISRLIPMDACVLEVGCGTGATLKALSRGYLASGIDSSPIALQYCRKRGRRLDVDNVELAAVAKGWELVLMLDVLEHLDDDVEMVRQAREVLVPLGKILVTVPAYQWLWGPHDIVNHHRRRYTRKQLRRVLMEAGFLVDKISYFNSILFPLGLAQRLIAPNADGLKIPLRPINKILRFIFEFEKYILRWSSLPWGLSILAVGHRQ